jgi:hypothetical protein
MNLRRWRAVLAIPTLLTLATSRADAQVNPADCDTAKDTVRACLVPAKDYPGSAKDATAVYSVGGKAADCFWRPESTKQIENRAKGNAKKYVYAFEVRNFCTDGMDVTLAFNKGELEFESCGSANKNPPVKEVVLKVGAKGKEKVKCVTKTYVGGAAGVERVFTLKVTDVDVVGSVLVAPVEYDPKAVLEEGGEVYILGPKPRP